jgi:hypothetical protein
LIRLNPDATHDASFANILPNTDITALALQADEAILVAGGFTQIGATSRSFLARLVAPNVLAAGNSRRAAATQAWPNRRTTTCIWRWMRRPSPAA